jgi:hypothetical protein
VILDDYNDDLLFCGGGGVNFCIGVFIANNLLDDD